MEAWFAKSTFDTAGWDDAPCRSSITSRDNTGFIQVGSRHHHLLQILMELKQINTMYKLFKVSAWMLKCTKTLSSLDNFMKQGHFIYLGQTHKAVILNIKIHLCHPQLLVKINRMYFL